MKLSNDGLLVMNTKMIHEEIIRSVGGNAQKRKGWKSSFLFDNICSRGEVFFRV